MPFLAELLLSVLQLAAFLLLWKACGRDRCACGNPWSYAFVRLTAACAETVRSAIPLPTRVLCGVLAAFALVCRAALLARLGESTLALGSFQLVCFQPSGFAGWFSVALLQFAGFLLALWTGGLFLRLWHFGRPLPGALGDLVRQMTWPLSPLRMPAYGLFVFLLTALFVRLCLLFPGEYVDALRQVVAAMDGLPAGLGAFDSGALSGTALAVFTAGAMMLSSFAVFAEYLLILIFFSLLTLLFRNPAMMVFLGEAFALLRGRLPEIRLGPIGLTPLLAYLAFQVAAAVGLGVWVGFFAALSNVVQGL